MQITIEQLKAIYPKVSSPELWAPVLTNMLDHYGISTKNQVAMFLAQTMHESGGFKFVKEIWGPTAWQKKYEGHKGLGNTQPGDGVLYKGRGLIQLTGRSNYTRFAAWVGDDSIISTPSRVEQPELAVLSAIWFWKTNNINDFADKDDIVGATKRINGKAMLGLEERKSLYSKAKAVLV